MPRKFEVPKFYRSASIARVKELRLFSDPKRRDVTPTLLDFGPVRFKIARHFGFCYGVENAIEIAYRAVRENSGKRIFLLSEMIHNPEVNQELRSRGVKFLMNTDGSIRIPFDTLTSEDIVIVPAFGTTIELQSVLSERGINPYSYDTTCPFVQKVWKRASDLGKNGFTVIVHGKRTHEETRATFSHSKESSPTLVVRDMADTDLVISYLKGGLARQAFDSHFRESMTPGFDAERDLRRIGVVNQTTMLATETQGIADALRKTMLELYGEQALGEHFADTRDTLCYATYENQSATRALIESGADIGLVVGGYNSSNTSHLVELCEEAFPTYYIRGKEEILSGEEIRYFDLHEKAILTKRKWLPAGRPVMIALTSGASCPDSTVDLVIERVCELIQGALSFAEVLEKLADRRENAPQF